MLTIFVLFISLGIFFLIGMPLAFAIGVSSLLSILLDPNIPLTLVTQRMFFGLDSWLIMAIPLFMLAGELMTVGGMSRRLVDFVTELFGFLKGSLGMISVAASMVFAGISGSSAADTAAVGSIVLPMMKEKKYNMKFSTALVAAAGSIGPVIPPSIMMIIIGYMTDTSVIQLFLGGIVPGVLIGIGLMIVAYLHASKGGDAYLSSKQKFNLKNVFKTGVKAIPGLGLPFIIIFGILGGIFTVTEAAVVSVIYGFIVAKFVYKELGLKDIPKILYKSAKLATIIMFIQATAFLFSWVLTANQIPMMLTKFITSIVDSWIKFLFFFDIIVLIIGMFMESFSATIIFAPLLHPVGKAFGIDSVHFGVVLMVGWAIGYITPPFGVTLFVSCSLTGESIREITPYLIPMIASMLIVLFIVTFFPQTFMWIPKLIR
ncbi:MAG: TRAP transporter large permease [Deltaproteobacteria bacterium]|nr:TRAP transporter large permease [Deltaproteobacteria bacterium]MBW2154077.1 TRAP transporter large permease [Deltaproteobacteria bacterium]